MYYASFGMLALIIHFIINFNIFKSAGDRNAPPAKKRYTSFLLSLTAYLITDILWGILYEWQLITLCYADTVVYFLSMSLSVFLWIRFVIVRIDKNSTVSRLIGFAGWTFFISKIIVIIVNFFIPVLFYFDAEKNYCPSFVRYIMLIAQIILFMSSAGYSLAASAKTTGKVKVHNTIVGLAGIIMTAFIFLQVMYPLLPFYAIGSLIVICIVHVFVTENELKTYSAELGTAKHLAYTDTLTGLKNYHAYSEATDIIDMRIEKGELRDFAVAVFDLNNLKQINDTLGHEAGDDYIRSAADIICQHFEFSPVFRIGGDEFVAFLENFDYDDRQSITERFNALMEKNHKAGKIVVSCGIGEYKPDEDRDFHSIFKRADKEMYECKRRLHLLNK